MRYRRLRCRLALSCPGLATWLPKDLAVRVAGPPRRAVVVGCGLGDDAEFVAGLGYETVAFDVAGGAIRAARRRFPRSAVRYVTADVLDPPASWHHAFDLVVESLTVQALPGPPWALSRAEIDSFGETGLQAVRVEELRDPGPLATRRWRAQFRRP